jgi:uncharacterized membrane protein YesL
MKTKAKATIGLLLAATAVAVAAMIHGAGMFQWNWFYPWVISPYIVLALMFSLPVSQSDARSAAGCASAAIVLAFTCLLYIDAMWVSVSSTSALIFIFAPAYLFVGGLIAWGLTWFVLARRTERSSSHV